MDLRLRNVVLDCCDLERMTGFWQAFTGYEPRWGNETYRFLRHPQGYRPGLVLQRVPEPMTGKNRLHLDLDSEALDEAVKRAESLGATELRRMDEWGLHWVVMQDPEGNQFCLQQRQT